jgi:hypothetical protein
MSKYMVLYNADVSARDVMANATPESMQASMGEWLQWREVASKTFKVDFGMPMQAVSRVSNAGVKESNIPVSGYAMLEGPSKDELVELLKSHPHLKRPGASIDVLEVLSMPGLDA